MQWVSTNSLLMKIKDQPVLLFHRRNINTKAAIVVIRLPVQELRYGTY